MSDEATPEQRRDAWLRLVSSFEGHLLGVREGARQRLADVKAWRADGCTTEQMEAAIPEWDATIWAADRLLSQLVALQAPEVPVDHARGQGSILELVPDPPSTVVEEPVDQRTWWQDDQGHQRHGEEDLGPWGNGHGSL